MAGRLVAVDAKTGAMLWRVKPNQQVNDVVLRSGVAYAGGAFTDVGGIAHAHLVAVNEHTGALVPSWKASANDTVIALDVTPDLARIIVGGQFTMLNRAAVTHLGMVTAATGAVTPWRPRFIPAVVSLGVDNNGVYVGGIGDGGNFAAFDLSTGATKWEGGTDGNVQAVALYDGIVYVGGHYDNYCGAAPGSHLCPTPQPREKALAIGSLTGKLQPWHPDVNSVLGVFALAGGSGISASAATSRRSAARLSKGSRCSTSFFTDGLRRGRRRLGNPPQRAAARRAGYARRAAMETLEQLEGVTAA